MNDKLKKQIIINKVTEDGLSYEIKYLSKEYTDKHKFNTFLKETLNITDTAITAGDKVFFMKGCTIPRFKIKEYSKANKFNVVKYIESATKIIVGKKSFDIFYDTDYLYEMNIQLFSTIFNKYESRTEFDSDNYNRLLDDIKDIDPSNIYISSDWQTRVYIKEGLNYDLYNNRNNIDAKSYFTLSLEEYENLEKYVNSKSIYIDEKVILKKLNSSVIMDEETYNSIKLLFDSPDKENTNLAMELMANCDYDKSAVFLLLLIKNFYRKLESSKNRNHVNFKALLEYFNIKSNNMDMDIEQLLFKLKEKNLFKKEQLAILIPDVLEEFDHRSKHYKASSIVFINDDGDELVDDDEIIDIKEIMPVDECDECIDFDDIIIDPIVYDELSEVKVSCENNGPMSFINDIENVISLDGSPELLLPLIKFFDENNHYELATLLTQSYLSLNEN